jgi:hypothetical protein
LALGKLTAWGERLALAHDIPSKQPSQAPTEGAYPVNEAERRLRHLLVAAGFEEGIRGEQLRLDRAIGTTTPDVIYRTYDHTADEGVCIYLDGMSRHLHGNSETAERDRRIRDWLRNNGYEVIEIAASDLYDEGAMTRHFRKLAGYLSKPELRERLRSDTQWFNTPSTTGSEPPSTVERTVLRLVQARPEDRYVTCLPLIPLKAAAGIFGAPQHVPEDHDWENWVALDIGRPLRPGMFIAQVIGRSMEPTIPDGAYCLFSSPVTGSRANRTVLVELSDTDAAAVGERYTVKRYESRKVDAEEAEWRHVEIILKPDNPDFTPIKLTVDDEGAVRIVAEFVCVVSP